MARLSNDKNSKRNWWQKNLGTLIMLGVAVVFFYAVFGGGLLETATEPKAINRLAQDIVELKVEKIELNGTTVSAYYKETPNEPQKFTMVPGESFTESMERFGVPKETLLDADKIKIISQDTSGARFWQELISTLLPILLIIIVAFVFFRFVGGGGGSGAFSFGKSRAKLFNGAGAFDKYKKRTVSFEDVAGIEEAKQELQEIVEFLKSPKKFTDIGARIPHGVLLIGPPGTGKTLLAKAVAGEAGVPFYSMSGSEFVEMFVGVGASRARDLFEQAKKTAPCIVFIDEIDAVGRQRGAGLGGGHDEREQTLNQILVEMDGFDSNTTVIVMAATNRPDVLDPALLRPGRFDRQVTLQAPDIEGRKAILKVHTRYQISKFLDPSVDFEVIAKQTIGFSGADLSNLVNEAAILAARRNKKTIGMDEFEEAIDRVIAGPAKKSKVITDKNRKLTAYHEIGHAVVGKLLPNADPVHKISIVSRGQMGGYTRFLPVEDRDYFSQAQFEDMIATLLAGYAAEKLIFNDVSTGASNDIQRATTIARKMITEYGMSASFGPMAIGSKEETLFLGREISSKHDYSEQISAKVDAEVQAMITKQFNTAMNLLKVNEVIVHEAAKELMEKETIDADTFNHFFGEEKAVDKKSKPESKKKSSKDHEHDDKLV
ncbi:MAG: ATP-dependent zinc metalloprotease FtsH [bacterium]